VEVLPDAEGEPQIVDAEGNLTKGEALTGEQRVAHYAALDRLAVDRIDKFLALD
jgi:hypothetical protein